MINIAVCPLLKQDCIKAQCAWFIEEEFEDGTKGGECAVVQMNEHLETVAEELAEEDDEEDDAEEEPDSHPQAPQQHRPEPQPSPRPPHPQA